MEEKLYALLVQKLKFFVKNMKTFVEVIRILDLLIGYHNLYCLQSAGLHNSEMTK